MHGCSYIPEGGEDITGIIRGPTILFTPFGDGSHLSIINRPTVQDGYSNLTTLWLPDLNKNSAPSMPQYDLKDLATARIQRYRCHNYYMPTNSSFRASYYGLPGHVPYYCIDRHTCRSASVSVYQSFPRTLTGWERNDCAVLSDCLWLPSPRIALRVVLRRSKRAASLDKLYEFIYLSTRSMP